MSVLWLSLSAAWACGQTTHVWTALHALEHLPEGELRSTLADESVRGALISGTMFPDGGYIPGDPHPYGEAAHWEPFQDRYLAWMAAAPSLPERDRHLAFLMGLGAHGIGDQTYDAAYLHRAQTHDGVGQSSDSATDVHFAALEGALPPNDHWVPYADLVPLFADAGIGVDEERLADGMAALDVAVSVVGYASTQPDALALNAESAPWATSHLDDPTVPGAPACLGEVIAAYWLALDARLAGESPPWVIARFPDDGAYAWPREGVDSTISVVFGRALDIDSIEGKVSLEGPDGAVPASVWMYYGEASNVLNIEPDGPLPADADLQVVIGPGVRTIGGEELAEPLVSSFSTGAPPEPVVEPGKAEGCGCNSSGGAWLGLLGGVFLLWRKQP